jgi:hypothetical protein
MKQWMWPGVLVVLSVVLVSCAHSRSNAPSAAVPAVPGAPTMAGMWQGSAWQVGAAQTQGQMNVILTVASDGTWTSSNGSELWGVVESSVGPAAVDLKRVR